MRPTQFFALSALLIALLLAAAPAPAQTYDLANELAVEVANRNEGVLCAEKDNIYLPMTSRAVRAFRIQAVHPAYIGTIQTDRWAPDWTSCDMSNDPSFGAKARRITFWETPEFWLTGYTFPSFWRPNTVPFRVGERVEQGLHVVQLWMRHRERAEEILVVYPPDGYWRARPLPFADMRWTAYGSSFLVGPVEVQGRPIVALKEIAFDPDKKSFKLTFERGGTATLSLTSVDQDRMALDVAFDGPTPEGLPFAALRSMYATEFNADVARIAWREKGGAAWKESPIMTFPGAAATEVWTGRTTPSRHNTSAPDMVFNRFVTAK